MARPAKSDGPVASKRVMKRFSESQKKENLYEKICDCSVRSCRRSRYAVRRAERVRASRGYARAKAHDQDRLPELPRGERMGINLRLVTQTAVRLHTGGERQENRKLRRFDH